MQFMSDPVLCQEKLLRPMVQALEKGVEQEDSALKVLSLRALGNMAVGAPKKVLGLSVGVEWSGKGSTRAGTVRTRGTNRQWVLMACAGRGWCMDGYWQMW